MEEIPSIWRTELLHALSVHFPIALLCLSAVTATVWFFLRKKAYASYLRFSVSLLLWTGTVLFWGAYYTGEEAYSVVVRTICDPTVLKDHLYWANVSAYFFTIAFAMDVLRLLVRIGSQLWIAIAILLLLIGGTTAITYAGHLGASVVYQQAGGVYCPSEDCGEFE